MMNGHSFCALKRLTIDNANNLMEWTEAVALPTERMVLFPGLEELVLKKCDQLTNAPTHFPCLQKLRIKSMDSGMPIANIISTRLATLTHVIIKKIWGLVSLPEGMLTNNKNLAYLEIKDCPELTCIGADVFGCSASLESLRISSCPNLRSLPRGLEHCTSLKELIIKDCRSLETIPVTHDPRYCSSLQKVKTCIAADVFGCFPSLESLSILGCPNLRSLPHGLEHCTSLKTLTIQYCESLECIPITQGLPSLCEFSIVGCLELCILPEGLECCTSLQMLKIDICSKITSIPITHGLPFLRDLEISDCDELSSLPSGLQHCTALQHLSINLCQNLEAIPSLDSLTQLRVLEILRCDGLKSVPPNAFAASLTHLKLLRVGGFWKELDSFPAFQVIPQLETLILWGWPKLNSLPEQVQHLTSLTSLSISSFDGMEALPEWLGILASLQYLYISWCENLMYLPTLESMKCLTKLHHISIARCPLLKERCIKDSSPEWPKISHIPNIQFDFLTYSRFVNLDGTKTQIQ